MKCKYIVGVTLQRKTTTVGFNCVLRYNCYCPIIHNFASFHRINPTYVHYISYTSCTLYTLHTAQGLSNLEAPNETVQVTHPWLFVQHTCSICALRIWSMYTSCMHCVLFEVLHVCCSEEFNNHNPICQLSYTNTTTTTTTTITHYRCFCRVCSSSLATSAQSSSRYTVYYILLCIYAQCSIVVVLYVVGTVCTIVVYVQYVLSVYAVWFGSVLLSNDVFVFEIIMTVFHLL